MRDWEGQAKSRHSVVLLRSSQRLRSETGLAKALATAGTAFCSRGSANPDANFAHWWPGSPTARGTAAPSCPVFHVVRGKACVSYPSSRSSRSSLGTRGPTHPPPLLSSVCTSPISVASRILVLPDTVSQRPVEVRATNHFHLCKRVRSASTCFALREAHRG